MAAPWMGVRVRSRRCARWRAHAVKTSLEVESLTLPSQEAKDVFKAKEVGSCSGLSVPILCQRG